MSSRYDEEIVAVRAHVLRTGRHELNYQAVIAECSKTALAREIAWVDLATTDLRGNTDMNNNEMIFRERRLGIIARIVHTEAIEREADKMTKRRQRYVEKGV